MTIEQIVYQRYRVPFRVPFTTSQGLEQHREGLLLKMTTDDGITGYGEAVSLPTFGTASLDDLEDRLQEVCAGLKNESVELAQQVVSDMASEPRFSPVRFALDSALLDLQADAAGLPISRFLQSDSQTTVPLNATISDMDTQGASRAAYYAVTAGYAAVKVKVGAHSNPSPEVERVASIREAIGPDAELRLDVNGSWSIDQAIEMASELHPFDISYLEQPLPARDISALAYLRSRINIPIAADESASSRTAVEEIIRLNAADAIIVKPATVGGITAGRELIDLARNAGIRVVVTTSLETGVAITAALHLAATLPEPVSPCGLATGALLETDLLVDSPVISGGRMHVPQRPGLGVEPMASLWVESG